MRNPVVQCFIEDVVDKHEIFLDCFVVNFALEVSFENVDELKEEREDQSRVGIASSPCDQVEIVVLHMKEGYLLERDDRGLLQCCRGNEMSGEVVE